MTDGEWGLFVAEILATFSGDLDDAREAALRHHFGAAPFDVSRRAIERLVDTGHKFVPVPGEMVAAFRFVTGSRWALRVALSGVSSDELAARETARHLGGERPELTEGGGS